MLAELEEIVVEEEKELPSLRNCLENQNLRRRRMKKVARRETSGSGQVSFRALKERKTFFPRLQRGKSIANCSRRFTSGYFLIAASRLKTIFKQFLNHSVICLRIMRQLIDNSNIEPLPELTLDIDKGITPDICVYPATQIKPNFRRDVTRYS